DQLRDSVAFRAWLAQIAKRVCWRLKERESLMPLLQLSALEDEGKQISGKDLPMDAQLAAQQMAELLAEAVDSLPASYRRVYQLRDVEELPGSEVAQKLGISLAAMKSRLHRARELLRQHLDAALAVKVQNRS
ncbi:MAG: sigma-70 family RNA polymerase sigma factor, partial [Terriglobales bacterium]